MMRSIEAHWDDYAKNCIPTDFSPDQVKAARASFYTGAQVVLSILYSMPAPAWSSDARLAVIDGLQHEIYVLVGRAVPEQSNAGHA